MRVFASEDSLILRQKLASYLAGQDFLIFLFIFVAYTFIGECNHYLIDLRPPAASIWVPAGIALAAVLLQGRKVVPAIFLGTVVVALSTTLSWLSSLAIACGNTAEVLIAAYLVNRFAGGAKAFSRPADFLRFCLFAGGLATAVSAVAGATVLATTGAYGNFHFFSTFIAWWTGDALGVLVVAPFFVLLLNGTHHPLHLRELGEMLILLIGLSVICVISFGPSSLLVEGRYTLVMLCIPFLVWAAIRFCPLEAAGACMLLCGFATWGSLHGYGPFANNSSLVLPLAAYLSVATAMTLTGAAAVASQREISEQLLESLCRLEQSKDFEISRLTSELEFFRDELTRRVHAKSRREAAARELQRPETELNPNPNDVVWFLDAETENILYVSPAYETISGRSLAELKRDPHAWLDTVHPEDREFAMVFIGNEFPNDRLETTYRVLRPDGSIRWIFDRGFVVRDLSGKAVRFIGVATDITEQVQQGEVVPLQLGHRATIDLREGEAGTQIRRKKE